MRALRLIPLVLIVPLLAGCFGAVEDEEPVSAFGACPQWIQREAPEEVGLTFAEAGEQNHAWYPKDAFGEPQWANGKYVFDLVLLEVVQSSGPGDLVLAASTNGTRLKIYDYAQVDGPKSLVEAHLPGASDQAGRKFEVYLSPVDVDATTQPAALDLSWTANGEARITVQLSYWDRVCGA